MKITKKGEYALRALIHLGTAHQQGCAAVSAASLALMENLPFKFLKVILFELRHAGFIEQVHGKQKGARLAKPMDAIWIGDVVRSMDGDTAPTECTSDLNYTRCSCPHEDLCGVRMLMIDVHQAILSILDRYSLQQLVDLVANRQRQAGLKASAPSQATPAEGFLSDLLSGGIATCAM